MNAPIRPNATRRQNAPAGTAGPAGQHPTRAALRQGQGTAKAQSAAAAGQSKGPPSRQFPAAGQPVKQVQHEQAVPALTKEELAELDGILARWERESDKVTTLTATFTMWEYDAVWGKQAQAGAPPEPKRQCTGEIHFAAPDKGSYDITTGGEDRWMCDGKSIYEFDHKQQRLKEYRLPKEMQGKAITNGPLPFVFGAKAGAMKQRYWMRITTPAGKDKEIWIMAWPRWQQDAANLHHIEVILDATTMLPKALDLYDPNPQMHKVYVFSGTKVNGAWDQIKDFFVRPRTPFGWQHEVVETPAEAPPADKQPPAPTADARGKSPPPRPAAKSR